jgi:hypothetical protein
MRLLKRFLQRLVIFGLGIFSVWFIVFVIFEFADRRLPWFLALAATYGAAAYIILPRIVRMGLKILKHKRVPSYTITGDGLPGDPVNLVLTGTLQQLNAAFATAGWSEADRLGLTSSWRMVRAFVLIRRILLPRSVPFIFSDAVKTSVSRRQLMTAHGSAITFDSGLWIPRSPRPHGERRNSG